MITNQRTPSLEKILTVSTDPTKMQPCKEEQWLIIYPEFYHDVFSVPLNNNLALKKKRLIWKDINCFHLSNKNASL